MGESQLEFHDRGQIGAEGIRTSGCRGDQRGEVRQIQLLLNVLADEIELLTEDGRFRSLP
jgi:hypothetical protein